MAELSNQKIKVPDLVKQKTEASAVISKMNFDKQNIPIDPAKLNLENVSESIRNRINNNDDILELFPDIEICIRILVSSIISPNDLTKNNLVYNSPNIRIPIPVKTQITELIKEYISTEYRLEEKQYDILKETLFTKGAYVEAIIPEASVDDVIHQYESKNGFTPFSNLTQKMNGGLDMSNAVNMFMVNKEAFNKVFSTNNSFLSINRESYTKHNYIPSTKTTKQVTFDEKDLCVTITDDYRTLLAPSALTKISNRNIDYKLYGNFGISKEEQDLDRFFMDNGNLDPKEFVYVNPLEDASRGSIGKPMILKLPVESVIPVYVTNDPSKHLGYFVMLDDNGTPVQVLQGNEGDDSGTDDMGVFKNNTNTVQMNLVTKAKEALFDITRKDATVDDMETLYSEVLENIIKKKLANGAYGSLAKLRDTGNVYHTMFLRALRAQETKLLFLPQQLVSYFAFEYRDNGTGKSLIEKSSVLFSIRSILLFTRMMANLKNSVTITNVNATLDDNEPDPEAAMSVIISNSLNTRRTQLPFGLTNVNDLTQWAQDVGFRYNFKGGGLPEMDITTDESSTNKVVPDDTILEEINKYIYMSFGLTPQMIDAAYEADYATTVVANNMLFAKYIIQKQNIYNGIITNHVRKIIANDAKLLTDIKTLIKSNLPSIRKSIMEQLQDEEGKISTNPEVIVNYILNKYKKEITVELPKPEMSNVNTLQEGFDHYMSTLEKYLDVVFNSEHLPEEFAGKVSGKLDIVKNAIKATLIRKWADDNDFLPEMSEFLTNDIDGTPVYNILEDYRGFIEKIADNMAEFFKESIKTKKKTDKKLEKYDDLNSDDSYGSNDDDEDGDSNEDGDSDDNDNDNGGDELGGDEFDFDSFDDDNKGDNKGEDKDDDKDDNKDKDPDLGDEDNNEPDEVDDDDNKDDNPL